jgi:flavin-dependent dehydrogenase
LEPLDDHRYDFPPRVQGPMRLRTEAGLKRRRLERLGSDASGTLKAVARGLSALAWLEPPAWLRGHPVSRLWVAFPGRRAVDYHSPRLGAWLVERSRLDRWLAGRAAQAGARVAPARARGLNWEGGLWRVEGAGGPWRAPWLIVASGAGGLLERGLGLDRGAWRFAALVAERPLPARLRPHLKNAALLELGGVAGGYAWAFGRGEVLNLGVAGLLDRDQGGPGGLRRRLEAFVRRLGLKPRGAPRGAVIPCPHRRRLTLARGRAALVGDAAGLADPVLGEGIAQAVISGRMAAQAILAGDLALYQKRVAETILKDHHHARLLARLIYRAPGAFHALARRRPGGVELGFNWLRGELAPGDMWLALVRGFWGLPPRLANSSGAYYSSPLNSGFG